MRFAVGSSQVLGLPAAPAVGRACRGAGSSAVCFSLSRGPRWTCQTRSVMARRSHRSRGSASWSLAPAHRHPLKAGTGSTGRSGATASSAPAPSPAAEVSKKPLDDKSKTHHIALHRNCIATQNTTHTQHTTQLIQHKQAEVQRRTVEMKCTCLETFPACFGKTTER